MASNQARQLTISPTRAQTKKKLDQAKKEKWIEETLGWDIFQNLLQVGNASSVGSDDMRKLQDHVGKFKDTLTVDQSINFMGRSLTGAEHESVVRAANKADQGFLTGLGIDKNTAKNIINQRKL